MIVKQIDELTDFNKHRIKFSAAIFLKGVQEIIGIRVLTDAEKNKHESTAMVCGKDLFGIIHLPKRFRSPSNRSFEKLVQHDHIADLALDSKLTLTKETEIQKLDGLSAKANIRYNE